LDTESLIAQLEERRDRLDQAIAALKGGSPNGKGRNGRRGPRRLSAAARRKISEAQKKRWAKQKKK